MATVHCAARGDGDLLSPRGTIQNPGTAQIVSQWPTTAGAASRQWMYIGVPSQDAGVELSVERAASARSARLGLGLQVSLTGNALADIAPVLSAGVRDAGNAGSSGRSLYAVLSKNIGLSVQQSRVVQRCTLNGGFGTGTLAGVFGSATVQFVANVLGGVEYAYQRINGFVGVTVGRYLQLRASELRGCGFAGFAISLMR